jgi:glycosyltransferase involved in cell wall biosynthesis
MRVYVVEASGKGGMIQYDYALCTALQRAGVDTTLVTSTAYELRDLPHEFRVIELLRLWDPRDKRPANVWLRKLRRAYYGYKYIREWLRLILFLWQDRPDVVLFGELRFAFEYYFLLLLTGCGLRLAAVVHDVRTYNRSSRSNEITDESTEHYRTYARMYRQFSALFVHEKTNYDLFLKLYDVPKERVHEIHLGMPDMYVPPAMTAVELREKLGVPPSRPVILFFGAITKYKGLDLLIRALPKVRQSLDAQLVVAGFPTKEIDMDELQQLAKDLGIDGSIAWFLEYVPKEWVAPLMEMCTVVVLPYRMVGQSGVLNVAYAHGKPVVCTRIGGLPDVIEDGNSGFLVPPEDPDALADAVIRVLSNPDLALRMGERARYLVQTQYSWERNAEKVKAVFEGLESTKQ